MALFKFTSISKADSEIKAADSVIDAALTEAKINTLKVNGETVAASKAPLADKISAIIAIAKPGAATLEVSEVVASNDAISKQLDGMTAERDRLNAGNQSLTAENAALKTELSAQRASVANLTAANTELNVRHEAALHQVTATATKLSALNRQISEQCLAANCLELSDDNGHAIKADTTQEEKLEIADKISAGDKLKAYAGAVNAAIASTGIIPSQIPNGGASASPAAPNSGLLSQYSRISNPTERARFYAEHKTAIVAASLAHRD